MFLRWLADLLYRWRVNARVRALSKRRGAWTGGSGYSV